MRILSSRTWQIGLSSWFLFLLGSPAGAAPQWCPKKGPSVGPALEAPRGNRSQPGPTPSAGQPAGARPPVAVAGPGMVAGRPKMEVAPRGASAARELKIQWKFPVYASEVKPQSGGSRAVKMRAALTREEAFLEVAGDDPRPLLVLRECLTCTGTDDALLTKQADNEKTMLMSRWFHCVKLPPDVLEENHPFHAMFAGDDPAHLFVSDPSGKELRTLNGAQSRTELWTVLEKALGAHYRTKHEKPLKSLFKVLNELDALDNKILLAGSRLDDEIEKRGPKSRKVVKIEGELAKYEKAKRNLEKKVREFSQLTMRTPQEASRKGA